MCNEFEKAIMAVQNSPGNGDSAHSTPDAVLIDAARNYAMRTAGQGVRQITVTLADGSKRKLEVPTVVAKGAAAAMGEEWPPANGWAVKGGQGAFNGKAFRLSGKSLAVFRELVECQGEDDGIAIEELKVRVWDQFTDPRTVQNAVSKLRVAIREGLGLSEDVEPIDPEGDRYRLVNVGE